MNARDYTEQVKQALSQYVTNATNKNILQNLVNHNYKFDHEDHSQKPQKGLQSANRIFPFNLDEFRNHCQNNDFVQELINNPIVYLRHLNMEIQEMADSLDLQNDGHKNKQFSFSDHKKTYKCTFEGNIGRNLVTPRGLDAPKVNKYVGVQGIISKITITRPKLIKSVHYCETTEKGSMRAYQDDFDLTEVFDANSSKSIPLKDPEGNVLFPEYGYWQFKDVQVLTVQELPETAPTGLLPRSIEVVLVEDLVDRIKPGDRIEVHGVFKCSASQRTQTSGIFNTRLIATNIKKLKDDKLNINITLQDKQNIIKLVRDIQNQKKNLLTQIAKSIAPSIYGHDVIKKSVLLQLVGGLEKNANGVHLRGDINILMIGDPSTAKSQMLRYVMNVAPLALNTTGRGASGVGLTAAVVIDRDTGQRSLEAGAMVLADRGIVCIDEFDKMDEGDRVTIHEAMEQQTVTIAKAGIHCQLNARCAVLSAANPIYGEYATDLTPAKNIGLPDSLLSRFDLLFIVRDVHNSTLDEKIADRVTRNHRFRGDEQKESLNQMNDGEYFIEPSYNYNEQQEKQKKIFLDFNAILHEGKGKKQEKELLTQEFLKMYISYIRDDVKPQLSEEAIQILANAWTQLRQKDINDKDSTGGVRVLPITIRTYETMIRLATAHAKLRLSKLVEREDCYEGLKLLNFSLFGDDEIHELVDENAEEVVEVEEEYKRKQTSAQGSKRRSKEEMSEEDEQEIQVPESGKKQTRSQIQAKQAQQMEEEKQKQQKSQTKSATRSQKKGEELEEGIRKIKISDDGKQAKYKIDQEKLKSIEVTKKETDKLWKTFIQMTQNEGEQKQLIVADELWARVKNEISSKDVFYKILLLLEDNGKIQVDFDHDPVQIYVI